MTEDPNIPGTVHLVDIEGTLRAKHASGGQHDIVLIPAPSDDPDDPLNWSAKRKLLSTACISTCVYYLLLPRFINSSDQVYFCHRYYFCSHILSARTYRKRHRFDLERP